MANWDKRYIEMAQLVASWSKDPRKQVGAIITKENYVTGIGFNGFPRRIEDTQERLEHKELKLKLILHAEVNAIMNARGQGDTVYVFPCLPCMPCFMQLIQIGIRRVVTSQLSLDRKTNWDDDLVKQIASEIGVEILFV